MYDTQKIRSAQNVMDVSFFCSVGPFAEEVTALRLGARRRSTGLCMCVFTGGCEPLSQWRGLAYIECARTPSSPCYKEFKVHKEMALLVTLVIK